MCNTHFVVDVSLKSKLYNHFFEFFRNTADKEFPWILSSMIVSARGYFLEQQLSGILREFLFKISFYHITYDLEIQHW